jgi:hypothetical protein
MAASREHEGQTIDPRLGLVEFVTDTVELKQVSSEYLCFPRQFSLHTHLSSGADTTGQLVVEVPKNGLSLHHK